MSGLLDFAYGTVKAGTADAEKTIATTNLTSATSVIKIVAVEDLGGGLKATVQYGIDPRGTSNAGATSPTRDESFIGMSGSMGNIRLGSPNSIGLTTFLAGNPFGTGIGGGYAKNAMDFSNIRYDRSARYDSPAMSGLTVSVLRADAVDAEVNTTGTVAAASSMTGAVRTGLTEIGAAYTNGPLTLAAANISQASATGKAKTSHNVLSANYKLGDTTVYASTNSGDHKTQTATTTSTKGSSVSLKQTMGNIDLIAGLNQQKNNAGDNEKVTGLRADYNFSKTTATYFGYEKFKAATAAADQKIVSIGLRKSF
jgi:predicted porin